MSTIDERIQQKKQELYGDQVSAWREKHPGAPSPSAYDYLEAARNGALADEGVLDPAYYIGEGHQPYTIEEGTFSFENQYPAGTPAAMFGMGPPADPMQEGRDIAQDTAYGARTFGQMQMERVNMLGAGIARSGIRSAPGGMVGLPFGAVADHHDAMRARGEETYERAMNDPEYAAQLAEEDERDVQARLKARAEEYWSGRPQLPKVEASDVMGTVVGDMMAYLADFGLNMAVIRKATVDPTKFSKFWNVMTRSAQAAAASGMTELEYAAQAEDYSNLSTMLQDMGFDNDFINALAIEEDDPLLEQALKTWIEGGFIGFAATTALAAGGMAARGLHRAGTNIAANLKEGLPSPGPMGRQAGFISLGGEDPATRAFASDTPAEQRFWQSIFENDADLDELRDAVPSARMDEDGRFSILAKDADALEAYIDDTVVLNEGQRLPPSFRAGKYVRRAEGEDQGFAFNPSTGRYSGAPPSVTNPAALDNLMDSLDNLAREGAVGKEWYERSSETILDAVGGDVDEAEKLVKILAITSASTEVKSNMKFALKAMAQHAAGEPINTGRFPQSMSKRIQEVLDGKEWSGQKTNSFYLNLMERINPSKIRGLSTMDMWMARAFGYENDAFSNTGQAGSELGQYGFAEEVTRRVARNLGWEPHQAQAAIWIATKARYDAVTPAARQWAKRKGIDLDSPEYRKKLREMAFETDAPGEEAMAKAAYDYADGLRDNRGLVNFETIPGRTTGTFSALYDQNPEVLAEYNYRMANALTDDQGNDILARAFGLPNLGTVHGFGGWGGETNRAAQKNLVIPWTAANGVDPAAVKQIRAYVAAVGRLFRQEGVAWSAPMTAKSIKASNGAYINMGRRLTQEETQRLYNELTKIRGNDWVAPAPDEYGVRFINEPDADNAQFQKDVKEAYDRVFPDEDATLERYTSQGELIENDWTKEADGGDYERVIRESGFAGDYERVAGALEKRISEINDEFRLRYEGEEGPRYIPEDQRPLEDAPNPLNVGGVDETFGPIPQVTAAKQAYMKKAGKKYERQAEYAALDRERAEATAQAFEDMVSDPTNPKVQRAYQALKDETLEQWRVIEDTGLKVEFVDGENYPYDNPREALLDIRDNNRLRVFKTDDGYGSDDSFDVSQNPLLEDTGLVIDGHKVLYNDLFRVVHDFFGHGSEGVGFRARGEENAYLAHRVMYGETARGAAASELRGQNSWVNFGPHGDFNRTASGADTIYADQKVGLLPKTFWSGVAGLALLREMFEAGDLEAPEA